MSSKKQKRLLRKADSGPRLTINMELLVKYFNGFKPRTIFTKSSKICDGVLNSPLILINELFLLKPLSTNLTKCQPS